MKFCMQIRYLFLSLSLNVVFVVALLWIFVKVGGLSFLFQKIKNLGKKGMNYAFEERYKELPTIENKVVFIGNSVTAAGQWAELLGRGDVVNRGVDGDIVRGMTERLKAVLDEKPKTVLIMIGINDLLRGRNMKEILDDYEILFRLCMENTMHTKFCFQSVLPVNNSVLYDKKVSNSDIDRLNSYIKKQSTHYGFSYTDLSDLMSDKSGNLKSEYTYDGLHLNGKAYAEWGKLLKTKLFL